jgi:hypothetical protein
LAPFAHALPSLEWVGNSGKSVKFETVTLTADDLKEANTKVRELYQGLLDNWFLIVGKVGPDALAPPHEERP